jgi:hypothetical protein
LSREAGAVPRRNCVPCGLRWHCAGSRVLCGVADTVQVFAGTVRVSLARRLHWHCGPHCTCPPSHTRSSSGSSVSAQICSRISSGATNPLNPRWARCQTLNRTELYLVCNPRRPRSEEPRSRINRSRSDRSSCRAVRTEASSRWRARSWAWSSETDDMPGVRKAARVRKAATGSQGCDGFAVPLARKAGYCLK